MLPGVKHIFISFIVVVIATSVFAHSSPSLKSEARFIENKGQWPKQVLFGARLSSGMVFIENDGLTFNMADPLALSAFYENIHHHQTISSEMLKAHAFKIQFKNTSLPQAEGKEKYGDYANYFIGNDPSKWAGDARVFAEIYLHNIYPGIDVRYYEQGGHLKYDFIVQPGAQPSAIQFDHNGISAEEKNNTIILNSSSIGKVIEEVPYSYQSTTPIVSEYIKNEKGFFSFKIKPYNKNLPLIIDPMVVFASFTGSTADNWGYTATYDESGKLYAAGIVFGIGYPMTAGVYQTAVAGKMDVSISKFSLDGSALIYSTIIGGAGVESPHSLVVSKTDELLIFGSTSSADYPTSATAYDKIYKGGSAIALDNAYLPYSSGSDIFITKLNATGSALVGSTLIGGSANDGLNDEFVKSNLYFNYGDVFRGEIIVDTLGNSYVATTTSSADFPIVSGFQNTFAGGDHDGVILKFNNDLSSLLWSSYVGGSDDDAAYSVQFDSKYDLYVTGGTTSDDFPTTAGVLHPDTMGSIDGFIAHISADAQNLIAATYIGTNQYDQCYFVQLDQNDNVFVFGQSNGSYPVFPAGGVYSVPNSKQFIHKLNSTLTTTVFSTVIGSGSGLIELVPSAFLVNNCEDIYISTWGGLINWTHNEIDADTKGMPITSDAYQKTSDGSDFYLAVLSKDADSLKYGTYFGGPVSLEHVDGGTSRFDKKGNVYQAVCAGCGQKSDFPTTPGAWSTTNKSTTNCNLAVIKFELSKINALISASIDTLACINETIEFTNQSTGNKDYHWDFGDGNSSDIYQPFHVYNDTGYYTITLIVSDPNHCETSDTSYMPLHVLPQIDLSVSPNDSICPGSSVTLTANGATVYQWKPAATLNQSTGTSVIATPIANTTYTVNSNSFCNKDSAQLTISLFSVVHTISPEDSICPGVPYPVSAGIGNSFQWTPSQFFSNPNSAATEVTLNQTDTVYVSFKTADGCDIKDSIPLKVIAPLVFNIQQDSLICFGSSIQLDPGVNGNYSYAWSPSATLDDAQIKTPLATPQSTTMYQSIVSNKCNADTTFYLVDVSKVQGTISNDTLICKEDSLQLLASGGAQYVWSPDASLKNSNSSNPLAFPEENTTYKVLITNSDGCIDSLFTSVKLATKPLQGIDGEYLLEYGESVKLNSDFKGNVDWSPTSYLSCTNCADPLIALPENDITYYYSLYNDIGCYFKDSVKVYVIRKVYVPNAFSPNGDNINDVFYFRSISVEEFEMDIFDRWGELLFTSTDINTGWNGTYKNNPVQMDVYVWKVRYRRYHKEVWHEEIGRVSLVR